MQALMVVSTIMSVVGSVSAGYQQAAALEAQADMYMKQAQIYGAQAEIDQVEHDRRIAIEKEATANESLERTKKLQRIIGSTIAAGAEAGISTQYGTITRLNEYSGYEAAIEEDISRYNSNNRIVSLNLNSAINQMNYANAAQGSVFQAGQNMEAAGDAITAGWMKGVGSLVSYGMDQYNRGSVPTFSVDNGKGSMGADFTYYPKSGTTVKWD